MSNQPRTAKQMAAQDNRDRQGRWQQGNGTPATSESPVAMTGEERAREAIEDMIRQGELSPAARDMDPREVIDQWAEANAASLLERERAYARAGLPFRLRADQLTAGDLVDIEPLVEQFGEDPDDYPSAGFEYATVEEIGVDETPDGDPITVLYTTEGTWGVRPDMQLEVSMAGAGRCQECGEPTWDEDQERELCPTCAGEDYEVCRECGGPVDDGEGWDGMCGNCADRAEADEEG